jgi:hypothetical protein
MTSLQPPHIDGPLLVIQHADPGIDDIQSTVIEKQSFFVLCCRVSDLLELFFCYSHRDVVDNCPNSCGIAGGCCTNGPSESTCIVLCNSLSRHCVVQTSRSIGWLRWVESHVDRDVLVSMLRLISGAEAI